MILLFKLPTSYDDVFEAYKEHKEQYQYRDILVRWTDARSEGLLERGYIYDFAINSSRLDVLIEFPNMDIYNTIFNLSRPIGPTDIQEIDNKLFLNYNND